MKVQALLQFFDRQSDLLIQTIRNIQKKASKNNVHDLRIATRRLQAVLWIVGHSDFRFNASDLVQTLRQLRHSLDQVRDLDMMIQHLKTIRTEKVEQAIHDWNDGPHKGLQANLKRIKRQMESRPLDVKPGVLLAQKKIKAWSEGSVKFKQLHALRIQIKKTRYILEALGESNDDLKRLQDRLGEIHDLQVLSRRFKKVSRQVWH